MDKVGVTRIEIEIIRSLPSDDRWPTTVYEDARGNVRGVQYGQLRTRVRSRPPAAV